MGGWEGKEGEGEGGWEERERGRGGWEEKERRVRNKGSEWGNGETAR